MDPTPPETIPEPRPSAAVALTSLILGILAVALSFLVLGFLFGLIGLLFGWAHLARKSGPGGMPRWGLGLSILGMIASIGFGVLYFSFFQKFTKAIELAKTGELATNVDGSPK